MGLTDEWPLVLDLSSNDIGKTDPACLKAHGVTGVILGTYSQGNPPHDMVDLGDLCVSAGLPVIGTYGLVYFGDPNGVLRDITWACEIAPHFNVTQVWADVETDACDNGWSVPRPTPGERIHELLDVQRYIEGQGLKAGIYSGRPFWMSQMANNTLFAKLPLWLPAYGVGGMPTDPITAVDFGGWNQLAAHQFTSLWGKATGFTCGREERDANYWYMQEDDMTPEEREEHQALVKLFGGRDRIISAVSPEHGMDYLLGYGMEQAKLGVVLEDGSDATAARAEQAAQDYAKEYNA